ncbi:MAG: DNA polymerase, partial [Dehalococcoidales bacterium]
FRLNTNGSEAARLMLDIRSLSKRIGTYLNIGKVDEDGRYRSSYKPVGTDTGRLASGETIFGTGGNQQNWPHDLLRFFRVDDGYILYSWDLSQIENRIVAYVGGVISQIEAFERGEDLHRLTSSIIFGVPPDQISDKDGSSDLGDGRQSQRFWGKKGNHATNYDVGYKTFALKYEISERDAKEILETIHRGYPQIREGYQVTIQNMLRDKRMVTNLFGRNRLFLGPIVPSLPNIPKGAVLDTFRKAYAQLPQSTTADKINEQGLEYIYYNQDLFKPVELLTQTHDAITFQVPLSVSWEEHARMHLLIKQSLETPLYWRGTKIDTPSDLSIGLNMCKEDMVEVKSKNVPTTIDTLAQKLKESYDKLTEESA